MIGVVAYSFNLNLTVMKIIGLYPSAKYRRLHRAYTLVLFFFSMAPTFVLGILHFVFIQDFTTLNYNDFILVGMIFYMFKLLPFVRNSDKLRACIQYFDDTHQIQSEWKKIIEECINVCRRNSQVFFVGCIVGLVNFILQVFLRDNIYELPLNVWLPNSIRQRPMFYYCIYFSLILGAAYAVLACGAIDPLIGGLSYHATAQLQVLKANLQYLDKYDNNKITDDTTKSNGIYDEVKKCIRRYQTIVEFVNEYQNVFSPVVFSQFMGSVLVIGMCCLQISKMVTVDINFFITINYLGVLFFQIFFYCYYGTLLIEENHTLSNAIYMGQWYEYNVESRKALIILMERSKRPMKVTAEKLLDLSLETFTMILRRSYSLLAVLKNY